MEVRPDRRLVVEASPVQNPRVAISQVFVILAIPHAPRSDDISAILDNIRQYDLVLIGTLNAADQPGQAALVRGILQMGLRTIVVALRMPYDLLAFPKAPTYLCTYSLLEPSLHALARALWGQIDIQGHLPVSIRGLYLCGHRQALE